MASRIPGVPTVSATCTSCGATGRSQFPHNYLCMRCRKDQDRIDQNYELTDGAAALTGGRWVRRGLVHHWEVAA